MTEPSGSRALFSGELPAATDVLVVGGGIAGAAAAYHLAVAGVQTLLLERNRIGDSLATAVGVLSPPLRQPFDETVRFRGEGVACAIWDMALRSIAGLADLLEDRGTAAEAGLDLSGGNVLADAHSLSDVESAYRALEQVGVPVEWLSSEDADSMANGRGFLGGYRVRGAGSLDPVATTVALTRAAQDAGASVLEGVGLEGTRRSNGHLICDTPVGEVRAQTVVYATEAEARRFSDLLHNEIFPASVQAMVSDPGLPIFNGSFATHWDLNAWRSDSAGRLWLGGWRHDAIERSHARASTKIDPQLQESIQGWFESAFPQVGSISVARRWSWMFGWTADYLPVVGTIPGRTGELVSTGFGGGSLAFAFEAGRVIASIVNESDRPMGSELLDPLRFT